MKDTKDYRVLAFDADDTLWDCQTHFDKAQAELSRILAPFADARRVGEELFATERKNLPLTGYGCKAFILSLIETAIRVSGASTTADEIAQVMEAGRQTLLLPATPLPGVEDTLQCIKDSRRFRMILFTKGELLDQQNKLRLLLSWCGSRRTR